ncbi:MAG: polysaccharide deacetylase family protein [Syntrophobacteraceae bacterium]|jgi:peptidoglycan/xylan/chitin deacetylase (PgdA/CDA1 family)
MTALLFLQVLFAWLVADLPNTFPARAGQSVSVSLPAADSLSCWSQAELEGSAADKKTAPTPAGLKNIPPPRTWPGQNPPGLSPEMANSIRSVKLPENVKLIALTFDLCEEEKEISGYDPGIVNYLRANGIKATFFAGGKWMRSHPEKTMQLMAEPLFEIGNHSWNHKNFRKLEKREARDQVLWTQAQYELLREQLQRRPCFHAAGQLKTKIPEVPRLFRFPFGACNRDTLRILQDLGLPAIQWNIVSGDPAKGRSATAIAQTVLRTARPGSIIVFHANGRGHGTADSLPIFAPGLQKAGFDFVTVSELLAAGEPVAVPECYEMKPGDNLRYDSR